MPDTSKLPEVLYVEHRTEDSGDYEWLSAGSDPRALAETCPDEKHVIGIYKLEKVIVATLEIKTELIVESVPE